MRTADFDYDLPQELIAQAPAERRSDARLLVLRRGVGVSHHHIRDLPTLLAPGDLMVVNDTRVIPARLDARRASGGRAEVLLLHPSHRAPGEPVGVSDWSALLRPARRIAPGEVLSLAGEPADGARIRVLRHLGEGEAEIRFEGIAAEGVLPLVHRLGAVPLPPYIRAPLGDAERYQTVYARAEGSAAAPTAGLHFTPELLREMELAGVRRADLTLHVGLGTFRPVSAERPEDHALHSEWFELPPETARAVAETRSAGARVLAVGTTVVRTLETQAEPDRTVRPGSGWTELFILPGRPFAVVDALLTNFHLPRSTLLMLVCAFGGQEAVLSAYREAVALRYRFFSFGDAMLIL